MTTHRPRIQLTGIAFALALAALFGGSASLAQSPNKLGTIDVQKILTESAAGQAALEELRSYRDAKQNELQQRDDKLKELQQKFTEGRLTLAEDRLTEMQKEIEDEAIALKRAEDDANREFQQRQAQVFEKIEQEVIPIIQSVGEELGFTMIFNKFQSGLVYADESIDITMDVIQRYNDQSGAAGSGEPSGF